MHIRPTLQPCSTRAIRAPRTRARASGPAAFTAAASLSVGVLSPAVAGPAGGVVVEGQGSISTPNAGTTVIDQSSHQLQLNWNSFNVGASESVQFNQPSSKAVAFNRILDQNPSQIFGRIDANGQVVLVNPNGLLIGRTAQLNVNSLVASSLDAIDFDAASGRYRFSTSRTDPGAVINEGAITAGRGGSVTLLGGRVGNTGSILADYGTVNLAAGSAATIDLAGDGLLRLEVGTELLSNGSGAASAVENGGTIQANGGQVLLTASAMNSVFKNLVNNTGVVRANRIENTGGTISLVGAEGTVLSSGTLDASAGDAVSTGGSVSVLGDRVGLVGNSVVDVSGATGGGTALIGGDFQGSNPDVLNASRTYVSAGSTLSADAGEQGDGGRIIVWADDRTTYDGSLSADGGSLWGNGGFAEVSGKGSLSFTGKASLRATQGTWGSLLLDPTDITINSSNDEPPDLRNGGDADYLDTDDSGDSVDIGNLVIEDLLENVGDVTLRATDTITQLAGADIDVSGDAGAAGRFLRLETTGGAGANITLNAGIRTNNGAVTLVAGDDITMGAGSSIDSGSANVAFAAGGDVTLTSITTTGNANITAGGAILNDPGAGTTNTRVSANLVDLTASTGIGATGAGNAIDIDANLLNAQANAGGLFVRDSDALILNNVTALGGGRAEITSATGNLTSRTVQAGSGGVSLTALAGSIVDDGVTGSGISAPAGTVALAAAQNIGTVTNFNSRLGAPIRITSANKISAVADGGASQINLRVPSAVTVDAGGIQLGNGSGSAGDVLIQSAGALNLAQFAGGAINLGASNNSRVALSAGIPAGADNVLTLNSAGSITNAAAGTLLLHGSNIVDNDGTPNQIGISAGNLIVEASAPAADKTLNTTVSKLDVTFGSNRNLTVNQTGTVTLGAIDPSGGNVTITATGGAILDDNNASTVSGNVVTLTGAQLGVLFNELDTAATTLNLTATGAGAGGSIYIREADNVTLTAGGTGGNPLDVRTSDGAMTVSSVSGVGEVILSTAGTAPRDITLTGNLSAGGDVTLQAGGGGGAGGHIIAVGAPLLSSGNRLTLTGASIGAVGGQRIQANANSFVVSSLAGGTFITNAGDATLLTGSAVGGQFGLATMNGNISAGTVVGDGVKLTAGGAARNLWATNSINGNAGTVELAATGDGGHIEVNNPLTTTGNVILTAGAPGNRGTLEFGSTGLVTAQGITANALSIGSPGARLNTVATSLNATTTGGGIYVQESNGLTLTATAVGGDLDVATTNGALSVSGASGNNVTLSAGGASSDLNLNAAISVGPGANVALNAGRAIVSGGNTVSGGSLTATAGSIGTSGARLLTNVTSLNTTSTAGSTFVTESDGATLVASATGGAVDVRTTNGALAVTSASGSTGVTLTAGGAGNDLTLNGAVNGGTGAVALAASGDGADINLNSTITTSGNVSLTAGSSTTRGAIVAGASNGITGAGVTLIGTSIGANVTRLQTAAASLDATATNGDLYVQESNGLTLVASATGGTVNVATTNGALAVTSASGTGVTLAAGGSNALTVNGLVDGGAGGTVSLTAGGAIVAGGGNSIVGNALNATGASIGSSGSRLATNVASLNTSSTNGGTYITEADVGSLTGTAVGGVLDFETTNGAITAGLLNSTGAGSGIRLVSGGAGSAITLNGVVAAAGDVTIAAGSNANRGALVLGGGASVIGDAVDIVATSIGTLGGRLNTTANSLNAQSTNGGIYVTQNGDLDLTASATGGAVDVAAINGALNVASASGANVTLANNGPNAITVNGAINGGVGGAVVLTAGGAIVAGGAGSVAGDSLTATGTSIGASGSRLSTDVSSLNTTSTNGGTFVTEANAVTLTANVTNGALDVETINGALAVPVGNRSGSGGGVRLVSGGAGNSLTVSNAINGGNGAVVLAATGDLADVNLGGAVSTTGDVTIAAGSATNRGAIAVSGGNSVAGNAVSLVGTSIGSAGGPLLTSATSLDVTSTNGGIFVTETDGLALTANATGGAVSVETLDGALNVAAASGNGVTLTSGGAGNGITVAGPVSAGANDVTLLAQGDGAGIAVNGAVTTTGAVHLTAGSVTSRGNISAGAGNQITAGSLNAVGSSIGAAGARLNTDVTTLDTTSTNGGTFVSETDDLTLTASAAGGAVDVQTNNGPVTVTSATGSGVRLVAGGAGQVLNLAGAVNAGAGDVELGATGDDGTIYLGGPVTTTGNVTLTAGSATSRGAINVVSADSITANGLTAIGASIGANNGRLATAVTSLNATATNGGIYVTEADDLALTASATGGALDVQTTNGALSVASASADGISLLVNGDGNDLEVNGPVNGGAGIVTLATFGTAADIRLAGVVTTTGNVALIAGPFANMGAIIADAGNGVVANSLIATATSIGSTGTALNTDVATLDVTTLNGSIRVAEANALDLRAFATGGSVDVTTANGSLTVTGVTGDGGVSLAAGGSNDLILNGAVAGGLSPVTLTSGGGITVNSFVVGSDVSITAGPVGARTALVAGAGNQISAANSLTISAAEIGTSNSRLNTAASSLNAMATNGGIYVDEADALTVNASATGGAVDVRTLSGALDVTAASGDGVTLITNDILGNSITLTGLVNSTAGVTIAAGPASSRGAVLAGANGSVVGNSIDISGSSIGAADARINTTGGVVTANSSNGGIFLNNAGAVNLTAAAVGGAVDVDAGGSISVFEATGDGVRLSANASGSGISVNGAVNGGAGNVVLTAGTSTNRGAIVAGAGGEITGASLTATGSTIGTNASRLNTRVATLDATSTSGGTYVSEADGLTLTANATGGAVDVQTMGGSLAAAAVNGSSVSLRAGGAGSSLTANGEINAGTGNVLLAATGAIVAGVGSRVTGGSLDVSGTAVGSNAARLNTNIDSLTAVATSGDVYVTEQNGLSLTNVQSSGNAGIAATSGDITVSRLTAGNDASLTASAGAIKDDGDNTTRLTGRAVTLSARSIGAASTMTGTTLDATLRLDIDATSLDATATSGGVFIDELNGLASVSVQANGGAGGDIELLTTTGDLNLRSVSASDSLLLSAGYNIFALPTLGTITARTAELRAGGADSSAGHIGTLTDALNLQLSAGNTLRMFVPQTVSPQDASRAPATLPSPGVLSTLSLFNAPSAASVQAGFGQFLGLSDSQFTSPAEALVRAIQNQTSTVQTVVGLDWASFDPNVSLFGTLDPAVCLPGDQRDEEQGASGC